MNNFINIKNINKKMKGFFTDGLKIITSYSSAVCILTVETLWYKCNYYTYNEYIKQLALKLSKENVFYVKFFQAACTTKHPLLTDEITTYLNTFTDNAPYTDSEIDVDSLERLIKEHSIEIKRPFVPFKSGTISLIFEGVTSIGESVIIKCKRIGIEDKIQDAIFNMNHLISISKLIPHIKNLNIHDIYNENKQSILDQLSFDIEVRNIELFYSKWKKSGLEYIKIPKVYSEITKRIPSIIVMERIFGETIYNVSIEDKDKYAKLLAKFNFKSVFYDAIYHGDIHPGNIFFIKELKTKASIDDDDDYSDDCSSDSDNDNNGKNIYKYKIGLIDFGIIGVLTRELQDTIFKLFKGLYEKEHNNVANCIIDNLTEPKNALTLEKKNELVKIISSYSETHFGKDTHKFLDAEDIIKINKLLYEYGVQFSKEFCRIELSFAISDSVCKLLMNKTTYIDQLLSIFSKYS